jgi:methyl-accepting chemotaxis protein
MAHSAQEAATGTESVVGAMGEVWQSASATGAAASQVLSAATALGQRAESLRAEVGRFLDKMRAAQG